MTPLVQDWLGHASTETARMCDQRALPPEALIVDTPSPQSLDIIAGYVARPDRGQRIPLPPGDVFHRPERV